MDAEQLHHDLISSEANVQLLNDHIDALKDEVEYHKADAKKWALQALLEQGQELATVTKERDELAAAVQSILNISLMDKGHWAKTIEAEATEALAKLGADKGGK